MRTFGYQKVYSLQEAFDAASSKEASVFMAGGTDLLVRIKQGKTHPQQVIDVKGIPEMDGLAISGDKFSIGALTCIRTLETASSVAQKLPLLAQAAAKLGSVQVRYRATIGGNLCNASPSADMAPPLLALDAQAVISGKKGQRNVELADFFLRPGGTVLDDGELLTRLEIPLTRRQCGAVYYKLSTRNAMDLAFGRSGLTRGRRERQDRQGPHCSWRRGPHTDQGSAGREAIRGRSAQPRACAGIRRTGG
jgi:CO/xanthine dehydrogenase FAD-binding subunit